MKHGVSISWEENNVSEMKNAARWLRQRAYELENLVIKLDERRENELEQQVEQLQENTKHGATEYVRTTDRLSKVYSRKSVQSVE